MASKSDVMAGSAFVRLWLKDDLSKSLSSALKGAGSALSSFGSNAKALGGAMMAGGAAIAAPLAGALVVGANFQDVMLDIAASTGVTSEQLARLNEAALNAKVGPTAAAQSFLELLKAGMAVEDVLGGAGDAAIAFARVGKMEAGEAAVVMADAMKVFGVAADVAANTISAAADASSTDINGMAQAFAQTSAVAALADQSIQDTAAALAVLANAGVKGSDSGTSLKTMLLRLMAPTDDSAKAMQELGLTTESLRDGAGNMLPLVQIISRVNQAMAGMDQAAKDDSLRRIFGTDAIRSAAILTSTGTEGFNAMRDGMAGALPVGEKFATIMGGLSGTQSKLLASLERIGITIAESLQPVISAIEPHIQSIATWFNEFAKNNTWLGPALATTAVGLAAVGSAIVAMGFGASALASVVTALGTLVAMAPALPFILAALDGIGLAFLTLRTLNTEGGIIDFGRVLDAAKETGAYLAGEFKTLLSDLGRIGAEAWRGIGSAMQAGDWKQAGEIAMAGVEAAMAAGITRMTAMWGDFKQAVLDAILGTAQIAVETLGNLAALGGPFKGLIGGGLAAQASDVLGAMGNKSRANKANSLNAAEQRQRDAEARLQYLSDRANEFTETAEDFVEEFTPTGPGGAAASPATDTGTAPDFSMEPGAVTVPLGQSRAVKGSLSTYNAAAASASGFMGGSGSPVEKMTTSVYQMAKDLKDLGVLSREQTVTNQQVVAMYERFLAAFQYG